MLQVQESCSVAASELIRFSAGCRHCGELRFLLPRVLHSPSTVCLSILAELHTGKALLCIDYTAPLRCSGISAGLEFVPSLRRHFLL